MRIYLDSRDHIRLIERRSDREIQSFRKLLEVSKSMLVYSLHNIMECCAPILRKNDGSNVMRLMNQLENIPHTFIAEASIPAKELKEATDAFLIGRKYCSIDPYVRRYDYVVSPFRPPATHDYLEYGLAHTIFELWSEDPSLFEGYRDGKLQKVLANDRTRDDFRRHDTNFASSLSRILALYKISFPANRLTDLASWIYEDPKRCPGIRLGYEVFHKLLKNATDSGSTSDIPDLAHVDCAPYVEAITLDNRIRGYVSQADRSLGTHYSDYTYNGILEVEELLRRGAA